MTLLRIFTFVVATLWPLLVHAEDACPATGPDACRADAQDSVASKGKAKAAPRVEASLEASLPEASEPSADLITQEVNELEAFMKLCQERIGLLKELRHAVSSGFNLSIPQAHARVLQEKLPLLSEILLDKELAPTASADDYLISKAVIPQENAVSFIKFLPLRNTRSSTPSSTTQTSIPSALLVAVQADGNVRLFTPSGEMVLSFFAGHENPVAHLAVSPSQDEYMLATGDASGLIRVHKVNVRQRRLSKEQKQARRSSTEEKVSQYLGMQVNVTAQFSRQLQVPSGSDGEVPRLTALTLASQQGSKYFVAGDAEGKMSIFTKNGTFKAKIDATSTPGASIEGLHSHLSNLLFRAGTEWGLVDLEKLEVRHIQCPKFEGNVTAAIMDSQQSSRVMVADDVGTIWVFKIQNKQDCKVEHRFARGITRAPLDLASIRGYTLGLETGGQGSSVLALNLSHIGKRKADLAQAPSPVVWRRSRGPVRDWAVHKRYQQGDLLAFLSEDGTEIEIAELLMSVYQAPAGDSFGNFKLPVIAVAIVLVLGYHYVKQKGKFTGGGAGAKKYDWDSSDFSAALKNKKLAGLKGKRF
mmetsp:Transcript_34445/g.75182  ORF Transcript_34445/g.75182 Transcript_34445/m.75182 type:complete len:586 (+) Transcript_34445:127-1884(+)